MKIRPVILCGGAGTRLWPKSKKNTPKQFVDWGGWTLFEKTIERIKNPIFDDPIITTNSLYYALVKKYLKKKKVNKYKIILEPFKKNTAPAILCAALLKEIPGNQPMIFFSSDNLISDIKQFNKAIFTNKTLLNNENIFIFGIKPKSPSTEYGYFLSKKTYKKINQVTKFIEKPNKKRAKIIIKKNGYMNSGMFYATKQSLIFNFKKYQKNIFELALKSVEKSQYQKNTYYLNKFFFKKIKEISFDYAILENAKFINAIKLNLTLTDLGNWKEVWKFYKKNNSKNNIKKNTFFRPWGKYINLFKGKNFLLKELVINSKSAISLQKHKHRSERWTIVSGKPKITINKKKFISKEGASILVPKGAIHRIENLYKKPVVIAEVQMGFILKETDIIRYQDVYGRVN
jgi:mannose-1-phosphate guanylyltransferase/mannose-6-phosphate isomerase